MTKQAEHPVFRLTEAVPQFDENGNSLHQHFSSANGAQMAAGIVYFKDSEMNWRLWYNELIMCHAVEGKFEIVMDGVAHELKAGDMISIPMGKSVIYRSKGKTTAFYAVTPSNWDQYDA